MKIKINENEVYEIKTPEVLNPEDFLNFLNKLDRIAKIIKINLITGTNYEDFKGKYNRKFKEKKGKIGNPYFDTKEKVLDIMQYFFFGTEEDKERICNLVGISKNELYKRFNGFKKRFNIKPEEIGFLVFGTRKNNKGIRIKDYVIKSHTGLFDEVGNGN
jgi:hypothetical protein